MTEVRGMRAVRQYGRSLVLAAGATLALSIFSGAHAHAAGPGDSFSLQLTPSPVVADKVVPGTSSSVPLQIRNNGTGQEDLKIEVRHFSFNSTTGQVSIDDTAASDLSQWVTFSAPRFSVAPGQSYTENIKIAFPASAGFSYSFVFIITRQSQPQATGGGRLLQGTIADFGLVNIDKPGAKSELGIASFTSSAGVYEYVPASLALTFKNTGNVFVQPGGDIFIGRGDVSNHIADLPVNNNNGYILPGTTRTLNAQWGDGFPRTETETLSDGTSKTHEVWNWADISKFRIGKYTARVVAYYNNGSYDIPLNAQVSFWIIPWKILLGALIIILIIGFGIFTIIRSVARGVGSRHRGFRR